MVLSELLEQQFHLPSIPKVVALLLDELKRPEVDLLKVTQLISTDPALTTRLRNAHSYFIPVVSPAFKRFHNVADYQGSRIANFIIGIFQTKLH